MTSEAVGIDSESLLFAKLQEHKFEIPNLISRRLYNDRRKITSSLCNTIRERIPAFKPAKEFVKTISKLELD